MANLSFTDQATLATDTTFINRVKQAMLTAAIAIAGEAASGKTTVDQSRLSFATAVLREPEKYARVLVHGVATATAGKMELTDTELSNIVASVWNAYAGVNPLIVDVG